MERKESILFETRSILSGWIYSAECSFEFAVDNLEYIDNKKYILQLQLVKIVHLKQLQPQNNT
jgi:hypothetical protein